VIGSFGAVWIVLAIVAVAMRKRPPTLVLTVVLAVYTAEGLATVLKQAFGRDRPYLVDPEPEPLMETQLDVAFPSGHASTSFAGATVLALALPRLAIPLYALAALISLSRVYVGVHYPLDIVAGALLGTAVGAGVWYAVVRRRRRPDQEPAPDPQRASRP
jgi:undecaprenyl-diphosphatase